MNPIEERMIAGMEFGESLLLRQFDEFYQEVIRMKRAVGISTANDPDWNIEPFLLQGDAASAVNAHLVEVIERQLRSAAYLGGDHMVLFDEACYVMTALADEIFLHSDWEGRYAWNLSLLETRFYGTHVAGERFFRRADALVASTRDAGRLELSKIYLMTLSLGFQGKFRGADPAKELDRYRHLLYYNVVLDAGPLRKDAPLFPSAYQHMEGEVQLLPPVRRWGVRLAVLVMLGLVVQHVVWKLMLTPDVWKVVRDILAS